MPPKRKEGEETNQEPKKIKVVMILNEVTGRYVREDGAVGKKILEKQKEDEKRMKEELERDKREEMDKLIYEAKLHEAERENERLRTLVSPEMLAAAYEAPCNHGWFNAEKSFGNELWRCKICRKEWKPFGELSDEEAAEKAALYAAQKAAEQAEQAAKKSSGKASKKASRFVSAVHNVAVVANVTAKLEQIAEDELEEASAEISYSRPRQRVGSSGLKSNLTDDFSKMFFPAQSDATKKGQGRKGSGRK